MCADLKKTVEIIFGAQDADLNRSLNNLQGQFTTLNGAVNSISAPLANAADSLLRLDAALAALAIGGMALAINKSSEFNSQFALISTSISATGRNLATYRQDILDYSTGSAKSISDINAALYTAAQAGIKYGESLEFIGNAEKLAVANKADLNKTVDLMTSVMNAYGFSVSETGRVSDVLFQSTLIGKQTIDSLAQSMGLVVGIAATAKVSFETLSAGIATLTSKGMETSEAITGIKGVLTTIMSPSEQVKNAAAAMGLTFSAASLQSRGLAGTLQDVMAATAGSTDKMVALFPEVRAMNAAMLLTGDGMKFFNDAMLSIGNSAGATEEAYKKMVNTFSVQSQMILNTLNVLLVDFGTRLEPVAADVGSGLNAVLRGFDQAFKAGAFDPFLNGLRAMGDSISTYLQAVAVNIPEAFARVDFSNLLNSLRDLARSFGVMFDGIDLTTVDGLAAAIQAASDIIAGFIRTTAGMVEGFRPFAESVAEFFLSIGRGDQETSETIGKILALGKAVEMAGGAMAAGMLAVQEYGVSISGAFNIVSGAAQVLWNDLSLIVDNIKLILVSLERYILDSMSTMSFGFVEKSATWQRLSGVVDDSVKQIKASINENMADAGAGLAKIGTGFLQLSAGADTMGTKVDEAGKKVSALPDRKTVEVVSIFGDMFKNVDDAQAKLDKVAERKTVTVEPLFGDFFTELSQADRLLELIPAVKTMTVSVDGSEIDVVAQEFNRKFPARKTVGIGSIFDFNGLAEAQRALDTIPPTKTVNVDADTSKLKPKVDEIKNAVEWTAKIHIADAENDTKKLKSLVDSIGDGIKSTGTLLGSLTSELNKAGGWKSYAIQEQIEAENRRRQQEFDLQKRIMDQQIRLNDLKLVKMESGDNLITIHAEGLKPALEMILWEVLETIQVRANEEASEFLLGLA